MNVRTLGQQDGPRTWRAQLRYRLGDKLLETSLVAPLPSQRGDGRAVNHCDDDRVDAAAGGDDPRLTATPLKIVAVLASSPAVRVTYAALGNGAHQGDSRSQCGGVKRPRRGALNIYTTIRLSPSADSDHAQQDDARRP